MNPRWVFCLCLIVIAPQCFVSSASAHQRYAHFGVGAICPRISPSGEQIVFSYQGSLWRIRRGGGQMTRLTHNDRFDVEPVFSPNGKQIAYLSGFDFASGRLRIVDADSGQDVPLPSQITGQGKLFYSPDGKRLLGNLRYNQAMRLSWLELESGKLTALLDYTPRRHHHALSADGATIVLSTTLDVTGEQGGNNGPMNDLWTMPASGGELSKIGQFPARIHDMSFAPDDKSIYVASDLGGAHYNIWQAPLDAPDKGKRRITFGLADEIDTSMSADGKWLVYSDNRFGATALVAHSLEDDQPRMIPCLRRDYGVPTGKFDLTVTDEQTQKPTTARVIIKDAKGSFHCPPGSLYRLMRTDLHFYVAGQTHLELPAGDYAVKIVRGPEYRIENHEVSIKSGETTSRNVSLRRWTDQAAQGWYSGEAHIHANYGYGEWYNTPATMLLQCAGEDLRACNFMVANSDGDGVFDREFFRGRPDPLSTGETVLYWNQEFRSTIWGHMTLLDLEQLVEPIFTGFKHTTNPHDHVTNADIADQTHLQGGHVNYTHPAYPIHDPYSGAYAAKEMPLDIALGKIDSIDVMGSNHLANVPVWYKLLNCGFRVNASAGTDCFLNRINSSLPGQDRAYVRVEGEFSYDKWIEGLQAGRSFVTSGPMLEFSAAGKPIGGTVKLAEPGSVQIRGRVTSRVPMDKVEVIYCGRLVAEGRFAGDKLSAEIQAEVPVPRTGWIALRVIGPNTNTENRRRHFYAHTGPVYLEVDGHPVEAAEDARYFIDWIRRLKADIDRRDRVNPDRRRHVDKLFDDALAIYERLASSQ